MRSCTSHTGFWRLTSFKFDSRLSWIWRLFSFFFLKTSFSFKFFRPALQNISHSRPEYVNNWGRMEGASEVSGFHCEVLQSDWFASGWLFESSPALVGHNYCSENKMINRAANLPDSFTCKIKIFMYISSTWKCSTHYFLSKSFICSLYSCIGSHRKVAVPFVTYEQHPDKASYISTKPEIDSRFQPIFFYKSQLYKFCTQEPIK